MNDLVSIVIPTFNEELNIGDCIRTLKTQTYKPIEIIIVDDGSTDKTLEVIRNFKLMHSQGLKSQISLLRSKTSRDYFKLLHQEHLGPGPARNLGASKAKGEILVFVDSDMTFEKNFIRDLVAPILKGKSIGTFSKNEMVKNPRNFWSKSWNINRNVPSDRMLPVDYPNVAPVFRAIKKSEFDKVDGFDATGEYTDDWSLSTKLGIKSSAVKGAIYYHSNPSTLSDVWKQARWIGKNKFISGSFMRQLKSLVFYSIPISTATGLFKSIVNGQLSFVVFKLVYDVAVFTSVVKSFFGERKSK